MPSAGGVKTPLSNQSAKIRASASAGSHRVVASSFARRAESIGAAILEGG